MKKKFGTEVAFRGRNSRLNLPFRSVTNWQKRFKLWLRGPEQIAHNQQ